MGQMKKVISVQMSFGFKVTYNMKVLNFGRNKRQFNAYSNKSQFSECYDLWRLVNVLESEMNHVNIEMSNILHE